MHCLILHSLTGHVDGVGMALNSLASKSSVFSTFYPVVAPFKNVKAPKPKMCKKKVTSHWETLAWDALLNLTSHHRFPHDVSHLTPLEATL